MIKKVILFFIIFNSCSILANSIGGITGLKLPRFVSLKSDQTNLRIGPSKNYPKILTYTVANYPIQIIDEFQNWRKIIDHEKNIGWIKDNLIKGSRFALIDPPYTEGIQVFNFPKGRIVGKIGKKNIVKLNKCLMRWCHINFNNNEGWVNKSNLWGVYEDEKFNIPFYQNLLNNIWKLRLKFNLI